MSSKKSGRRQTRRVLATVAGTVIAGLVVLGASPASARIPVMDCIPGQEDPPCFDGR